MGSSPLRAKQALFDDWGLSEDEDTKPSFCTLSLTENVKKEDDDTKPRLDNAEVEHRRKSRAFAVAYKERKQRKAERKELKRRRQEEQEKEQEKEQKEREEELREKRRDEEKQRQLQQKRPARREVIDLTGPTVTPIPPPQIPPPPRRAQSAIEFVRKSATLRRTSSNPLPSSQTGRAGQASKKRKTESSVASIPSSGSTSTKREIFTDLSFYYVPDSALGARKLRIAKAQQHGATWVRNPEEATHVIVDKPFTWAEIESAIEARRPDAIVVYDEYPLDCIGFRCLLNPSQRRYQIKGRDEVDTEAKEKTQKTEKTEAKEKTESTKEYTIKPARRLAGSSSRSHEREQMIRQPRKG